MRIQEVLNKTTQFFKEKKIASARLDAELLISKALGLQRIDLYLKFDQPLKEEEVAACRELVRRRAGGEPVAYIFQEKGFFGLDFFVDSRVLIPRPESELLVEKCLEILARREMTVEKPEEKSQARVMDLGCGSGCLALSILAKDPNTEAVLVDRSEDALAVARLNAERLQLGGRCHWVQARVQELKDIRLFDVIVANPPYIRPDDPELHPDVRKYEPHLALFGGDSGMDEVMSWLPVAYQFLKPGGYLLMEIGMDQGEATRAEFNKNHFLDVQVLRDLAGLDRIVMGRKDDANG